MKIFVVVNPYNSHVLKAFHGKDEYEAEIIANDWADDYYLSTGINTIVEETYLMEV